MNQIGKGRPLQNISAILVSKRHLPSGRTIPLADGLELMPTPLYTWQQLIPMQPLEGNDEPLSTNSPTGFVNF
eukprot:1655366-Amphidinium_carterae.1